MSKANSPVRPAIPRFAREVSESGSPAWERAYRERQTEIAIRMGRFFVEHLVRLYRAFDGDLVQVIILGEIGHHNTTRTHSVAGRAARARAPSGAGPSTQDFLPCNALSLSHATGIPRETVRRKIAALVRRGWVSQNARGEAFVTAAAGAHFMPDFNRETLLQVLALSRDLQALLEEPGAAEKSASVGG